MRKMVFLIISMSIMVAVSACKDKMEPERLLKKTTIAAVYPGNIMNVDKIELADGSSGERRTIDRKQEIDSLLIGIKDIVLTPHENQEGWVGYVYRLVLYENDQVKLDFLPNELHGVWYQLDTELEKKLRTLYREKFQRDFK